MMGVRQFCLGGYRGIAVKQRKQPCFPGPELVLLRRGDDGWVWYIANEASELPIVACVRLEEEEVRYRDRQADRN